MQIANANICIKNRNSCFEAKRNQDSIPYQIVYGFETIWSRLSNHRCFFNYLFCDFKSINSTTEYAKIKKGNVNFGWRKIYKVDNKVNRHIPYTGNIITTNVLTNEELQPVIDKILALIDHQARKLKMIGKLRTLPEMNHLRSPLG